MEHRESRFIEYKNLNLYYQCWLPPGDPKAILLVVHGLTEHSRALYKFGQLFYAQRLHRMRSGPARAW